MRNGEGEASAGGQLEEIVFELHAPAGVGPAAVHEQQDAPAFGIVEAPPEVPPPPDALHHEGRGLRAGAHGDETAVVLQIVDAVRDHFAFGEVGEVVVETFEGFAVMGVEFPVPVEAAQELLLFGVHAERGPL